jgi:TRAP-type C4-dicarboxylate transport system permease small subunit
MKAPTKGGEIVKFLEKVTNVFTYIAGFCLAFMFIAITLNIFLRLLGKSVFGLDEINEYLMPWVCFLSIPVGVRLGREIDIDIVTKRLPARSQRALRLVNAAIAAALFIFLAVLSANMVIANYKTHWVTCQLMMPIWVWQLCLPLGSFLYGLESIDLIGRIRRGESK